MIQEIETIDDVMTFISQVAGEITDFHPMEDFRWYVNPETQQARYTDEEAGTRNTLLERCIDVLTAQNADFCTFLLDVFEHATDHLAQTQTR